MKRTIDIMLEKGSLNLTMRGYLKSTGVRLLKLQSALFKVMSILTEGFYITSMVQARCIWLSENL